MMSPNSQLRRAAAAAFIGTAIEWYDFYIYATAAALVFGDLFFPSKDRFAATMASFATFAVGFTARPLGALLFGHIGDRIGRKRALLSTLVIMGAATVGIGLLPTPSTVSFAPGLLVALRLVQGIAVGGEWGGAVLISGEHAPPGRRTFFASFAQLGSPAGLILSMLAFQAVASLDTPALMSWGWRMPFLASGVLLAIGFFIRIGLAETPEFKKNRATEGAIPHPVLTLLCEYKRLIALSMAANTVGIAGFYFTNTYMLAYTTQTLGLDRKYVLGVFIIIALMQLAVQLLAARWAERVGVGRFLKVAAFCAILSPYPMFVLVNSGNLAYMTIGIAAAVSCLALIYSVIAGFVSGMFPAAVRYSAISISYQFCAALTGGSTPLAATWIAHHFRHGWWPLAVFYSGLAGLSLLGIIALDRFKPEDSNGWD